MRRAEMVKMLERLPKGDLTVKQVIGMLTGQVPVEEKSPVGLQMSQARNGKGVIQMKGGLEPRAVKLLKGDWFRVIPHTVRQVAWLQGLSAGWERCAIPAGLGDGVLIHKSTVGSWPE
jgi:hypothetical protein